MTNKIYCQVSRTNPLPTFKWQHQGWLCIECKPDKNLWRDINENFDTSPSVDMPTAKSTLIIPKDAQSGFFRCVATNARGSDYNVLKFSARGELSLGFLQCCCCNPSPGHPGVLVGAGGGANL